MLRFIVIWFRGEQRTGFEIAPPTVVCRWWMTPLRSLDTQQGHAAFVQLGRMHVTHVRTQRFACHCGWPSAGATRILGRR